MVVVMSIRKPKMILIDVDGTLVDSVPDLAYCVDEMMKQLGRPTYGEDKVRDWVGNGVERLTRRALIGQLDGEPSDEDFEKAYPIFLDLYAENTSKRSVLYPGVEEGMEYMKSHILYEIVQDNHLPLKPDSFRRKIAKETGPRPN